MPWAPWKGAVAEVPPIEASQHQGRRLRVTGPWRVWILISAVVAVALLLIWTVRDLPLLEAPIHITWLLLIPLVYVAELTVVHLQFRRDAHSFSMSEIPLVVGLYFTSPLGLIGAQLIGNALALGLNRRQSPIKLAFNLSQFTLQSALAVVVFRSILDRQDPLGAAGWIGVLAAMGLAVVVANVLINTAIHLSGGMLERSEQLKVLKLGAVAAVMNASLGLVAVTVMWTQRGTAWTAAVPPVILYLAYRAYVAQRQEHRRLQALYEATKALHRSPQIEAAMLAAATHARSMFEAERAEILIFPDGLNGDGYRTAAGPRERQETMQRITGGAVGEAWAETLHSGRSRLVRRESGHRRRPRRGTRDEMMAPVHGPEGTTGVMVVADPLGDVATFTARDLRFLETLASQVSVSLENGRLEDSLAQVTRLKEDLRHQTLHDALTGLANRVLLRERLGELVDGAAAGSTGAILCLDLDDFKAVNDTLGHPAGDQLLVEVARRLQSCCRPHDTVARLGGDEFAILLERLSAQEDAIKVVERIIDDLRQPFVVFGQQVTSHASVGIAFLRPGQDPDELIRHADQAMYAAKGRRKGSYQVFEDGIQDQAVRTAELRAELESAIERNELILHYQPIVELATGQILGLEALVRWCHPQRGMIQPAEFIPLAEETGLIVALGRWVLQQACWQASQWHAGSTGPKPTISVNLSPRELADADIVDEVRRALRDSRLEPQYLVVEITENVMIEPFTETLDDLKDLGVRIAVDDFGTGYSSLGYLDRLPIDIVKVDRSFVKRMAGPDQSPLVRIVLEIGDVLGLDTVAEGIETADQLLRLQELGCRVGQGYFLAPPLEAEAVEALLRARKGETVSVFFQEFQPDADRWRARRLTPRVPARHRPDLIP